MAWVTSGSGIYSHKYSYPDGFIRPGANIEEIMYTDTVHCDNDSC